MNRFIDLTGQKFNRLTVLKRGTNNKNNQITWDCQCVYGNQINVVGSDIKSGHTKSCGCARNGNDNSLRHNHSRVGKKSKTYNAWVAMKQRCNNPNCTIYKYYGGRKPPITVCNRWLESNGKGFLNFLRDVGEIPKGKSLDRIDNNGNYCPKNCKLSTPKQQANNRRNNKK